MSFLQRTRPLVGAVLAAGLLAGTAQAQGFVVIERTNAQTAPGHFTSAITVTRYGRTQVIRLGEQGLSRANYWDDDALIAWGTATFNARVTVYTEPDIPEKID